MSIKTLFESDLIVLLSGFQVLKRRITVQRQCLPFLPLRARWENCGTHQSNHKWKQLCEQQPKLLQVFHVQATG